jgi:hypothetical protein
MRPILVALSVSAVAAFACGVDKVPGELSASRGKLLAGSSACSQSAECSSESKCVRFIVGDGGSYCAPKNDPCGILACDPGDRCICHISLPGSCGCNPP